MNTAPRTAVVPLTSITLGSRARLEYGDLGKLKTSIQKQGLIQPIAVKDLGNETYLLLAGGRRYKACLELDMNTIPIRIYDRDLIVEEEKAIELEENLQRLDLSWPEECALTKQIHELQVSIHGAKISTSPNAPGWSQQNTSDLLGIDKQQTSTSLQLADAIEILPSLATCETKSDAIKMMKKLMTQFTNSQIAEEVANRRAVTPLEVLRKQIVDSYITSDCVEGMKQVPRQSIDLIEIDPPYAIKLTETKTAWHRGNCDHDFLNKDDYNEIEGDLYLPFIESVIKEAYRVLKVDSWLLLWFAPDPWFEPLSKILRSAGFMFRALPLLWLKGTTQFMQQGQTLMPTRYLAHTYELCFYVRKGNAEIQKQGRLDTFLYPFTQPGQRIHPTERPIELMEELLSTFTTPNSAILVPFAGSGNTILAAFNLGMTAFGYDLSKAYRDAFVARAIEFTPKAYQTV